jgi:anti-anti-sigma factor
LGQSARLRKEIPISEALVTSVKHLPQAVVVQVLAGELGKSDVDGVCKGIDNARITAPSLPYILDMANVSFVPSVGMGVLVGLNQEFRSRGQRLIFAGLQTDVRQTFAVTHVDRILEIMDDLPTALRSVGADA